MVSRDALAHQDARELKTYIANQLNSKPSKIDLSHVKRASLSSIQLMISTQKQYGETNSIEWDISSDLQGILSDLGASEFFDIDKGE